MKTDDKAFISIAKVSGAPAAYPDIKKVFLKQLDDLKPRIKLFPQAVVLIKINLCLLLGHETGATNDPRIVRFFCDWLMDRFNVKKIYLAEADATHLSADMAFRALGWERIFADAKKVELLNVSRDELKMVETGGTFLKSIEMSRTLMDADYLVSFAKLKTHTTAKITCIMKNQFGAIPEKYKARYHHRLPEAICDATMARIPDLCVVDGVIAMEGYGPVNGTPRRSGLLLVSNHPVAMDHACARIMGFNPRRVPHLLEARRRGMGGAIYDILGDAYALKNMKFRFVPAWKVAIKNLIKLLAIRMKGINYHEEF